MVRAHNRGWAAAAAFVALTSARDARAQPATPSGGANELARRALIQQAQDAARAGRHAEALEYALRAGRLAMTPSLRAFVAEEQGAVGAIVEALANAEQCAREARVDPALRNRELILTQCTDLAASLSPRVGRVTVQVASPPPAGLRVTVAGAPLADALYGVPYVVAPGSIAVAAEAPGMRPLRREVAVAAGQTVPVPIALERDPAASAVAVAPLATPSAPVHPPRSAVPPTTAAPRRTGPGAAPFVVIGAGGAWLVASAVLLGAHVASVGELAGQCTETARVDGRDIHVCPDSALPIRDRAEAYGTASAVAVGVGAALVVGGVIWAVTARGGGTSRPGVVDRARARLDVSPPPRGDGFVLGVTGAL